MKIIPLASDSMGTRSMATLVITSDVHILIDPSAALGPRRYKLPPHEHELLQLQKHKKRIEDAASESGVLIVTHYHFDHYDPGKVDMFSGKTALIKHPLENINKSQKNRADYFIEQMRPVAEVVEYADGRSFNVGATNICFSQAVYHGTNNRLGYVVEVAISDRDKVFVFTSDVEGTGIDAQADFIIQSQPDVTYIDGPMTYMLGYRYSYTSLKASIDHLIQIIEKTSLKTMILDHHLLRDLKWKKHIAPVFDAGVEHNVRVLTAAEYCGMENSMLEARRKELYLDPGSNISI